MVIKTVRNNRNKNFYNQQRRRQSKRECIAITFDMQYADHREVDETLACELQGEDLNGKPYKMVNVKGLTKRWAQENNIKSGITTIFVTDDAAEIDDELNQLIIPQGATIKVSQIVNFNVEGERSFLVRRLTLNDTV